jgi:Cupin-like domain
MQLKPVATYDVLDPETFKKNFYEPGIPVVIKNFSKDWPAYTKWSWEYFRQLVGNKKVPLYNNVKSDAYTPINKADDYKTFGEYIDMISKGPAAWRIFLFNIFDHAPQLTKDFTWPENYMKGYVKKYPMLFTGGEGSITHMHFDIDMSHILHTQFGGRKRVLMFPYTEQHKLYRKPWEVLSLADFSNYYVEGKVDYEKFPALKFAEGVDLILEPGDTLFMPAGYWHHMEYLESGFAMSLRAMQPSLGGKLKGVWNLFGMRTIDTVMKKTLPKWWYNRKEKKIFKNAEKVLAG